MFSNGNLRYSAQAIHLQILGSERKPESPKKTLHKYMQNPRKTATKAQNWTQDFLNDSLLSIRFWWAL